MTNEEKAMRALELQRVMLINPGAYLNGVEIGEVIDFLGEFAALLRQQASVQAKLDHYDKIMAAEAVAWAI